MNVLYQVNELFLPQVSASVASVCTNNEEADSIHFYVLGMGLSQEAKSSLELLASRWGRSLDVVPIHPGMPAFALFAPTGWNEVVVARLLVGSLLPRDVHQVLYLDADTIVRGPLTELWNEGTAAGYVLGAVIEPTVDRRRLPALGLVDAPYFNSGVLLIDLDAWRSDDVERAILSFCETHRDVIVAPDQDAINGTLVGRICALPPTYNYCNSYEFYPYRTLKRLMGGIDYYTEGEVAAAIRNPTIVHYLGEERPWRRGNTHSYRDDYRAYLALTDYAGVPEEGGWETYFKVWTIFNTLMRHAPLLRYRIITLLIPAMLAMRSRKDRRGSQQ